MCHFSDCLESSFFTIKKLITILVHKIFACIFELRRLYYRRYAVYLLSNCFPEGLHLIVLSLGLTIIILEKFNKPF